MQNKHQLIVTTVAVLGLGYWIHISSQSPARRQPQSQPQQESAPPNSQPQASTSAAGKPTLPSPTSAATQPQKDLESLEDMSRTLFQFTRPESRLVDLVQYLESSRQQPQVTHDSNPDTGEMVIVRTRSPLPGTRYFHAQYFSDENNKSFVQHMSFEFKPGPTAMNDALNAVENAFPNLPDPKVRKGDFIQWEVPGGYVLWIQKMKSQDLQDDPFNAYTEKDVGTIRVAMELEIHGEHESR